MAGPGGAFPNGEGASCGLATQARLSYTAWRGCTPGGTDDPRADTPDPRRPRLGRRAGRRAPARRMDRQRAALARHGAARGRHPTRDELDRVAPANPVYLNSNSHDAATSSLALRLCGIDASTPDPA